MLRSGAVPLFYDVREHLPSNPEPQDTERKQTSKQTNKQRKQQKQSNKQTNKVRKGKGKGKGSKGKGKGRNYFGLGSLTGTGRSPRSSVLHVERRCEDRVYFSVHLLNVSERAFCCFVAGSLPGLLWRCGECRCGAACGRPEEQL
jgi:hypothetical protein